MSTPDPRDPALIIDASQLTDEELREVVERLGDSGDDDQHLQLLLDELNERMDRRRLGHC